MTYLESTLVFRGQAPNDYAEVEFIIADADFANRELTDISGAIGDVKIENGNLVFVRYHGDSIQIPLSSLS